jgi:predicted dehydrogenase
VAIADVDDHRRRRLAGSFDVSRSFADIDTMLHDASVPIDVVAVCSPAQFHADAVIAALRADKHVLVEKPLALGLDDADRIVAEAEARPRLKVMVGFNLRHHRLVQRAARMISDGRIGELQLARTAWTASIRIRTRVPDWRNHRTSGGGVLSEIAVHHFDLLRFLAGAPIESVYAETRPGEGDDESATLTLRLKGGATASCAFAERSADRNELELFGTQGSISFSLYRFDSLTLARPGRHGGRLRHAIEALRDVPEVWPIVRRGGDFRETYRRQWLAMLDAIRRDARVDSVGGATVHDGREALRVVLAAGASANAGRPVTVADAPRVPEPAPARPARSTESVRTSTPATGDSRPQISAVLSTRSHFDAIRVTVQYLRAQTVRDQIELLIVCPNARDLQLTADDEALLEGFWQHRTIEIGPFDSVAPANAAGVRAAGAPVVVLCEDHAFPDPNWAENLILAHRGPYAGVGPAVHNANPSTAVSRADFLIGYGPWAEPIKPCEPAHLPGHNSAYKRDVLLSYGDRLEEMMQAESVLHWDLRRKGLRLYLDPGARLAHTNFAQLGIWTGVQFHSGRVFAGTRASGWSMWKRTVYTLGSPLIPLVRFSRVWRHARRVHGSAWIPPTLLLAVGWGLALDGLGQLLGYALGPGESRSGAYEFCRLRFVTDADRQRLGGAVQLSTRSVSAVEIEPGALSSR